MNKNTLRQLIYFICLLGLIVNCQNQTDEMQNSSSFEVQTSVKALALAKAPSKQETKPTQSTTQQEFPPILCGSKETIGNIPSSIKKIPTPFQVNPAKKDRKKLLKLLPQQKRLEWKPPPVTEDFKRRMTEYLEEYKKLQKKYFNALPKHQASQISQGNRLTQPSQSQTVPNDLKDFERERIQLKRRILGTKR